MEIYTIGFTKKTAEEFFETLKRHEIKQLVDIRLNNSSQLAGFTKRDDLAYFLRMICDASYLHESLLSPTQEILDDYKKNGGDWKIYVVRFLSLMEDRRVALKVPQKLFETKSVLLCSEPTATFCHRRLVAEYLSERWGGLNIIHL